MGTQLLLSLITGAIAGGGLLLIIGKYAYKWYKKEKISISGEILAIALVLIITGGISAYKAIEASYSIAKDGINYTKDGINSALHTGQQVIEKSLRWGTITLLEGVGQPYHEYQKKWEQDKNNPLEKINIKVIKSNKKELHNQQSIHLTISVENRKASSINLNQLFKQNLLILTDNKNNTYSLKELNYKNGIIQAGETSEREIEIITPKGVELYNLSTPQKQLLINQ